MRSRVAVSLGSNSNAEANIKRAVKVLREKYGELTLSPVYQTASVGFKGDDFLNLVASFFTAEGVTNIVQTLKSIEQAMGRVESQAKYSSRTIDLDLLIVDDQIMNQDGVQIPRHEILHNAFVLKPLTDIHGELNHPVVNKKYAQLWQEMQPEADRIEVYDLDLS